MAVETVKIGNLNIPKPALMIGAAAGVGILFYVYWSRTGGTGGGDPSGIDPDAGMDPYTGLPYSDQFGFGSGYSGIGVYDPGTGGTIGGGYGGQIVTGATTNAMWSQAAIAYMETHGYEGNAVSNALGKVLTGRPLTVDELNIFNAARAVQGEPPQAYPLIQMVGTQPPGTTNPPGSPYKPGKSLPAPTGLRLIGSSKTGISVSWKPVTGAKGYAVYIVQDSAGGGTPRGIRQRGSVVYTSITENGLQPGKRYRFDVHAIGGDNQTSGRGARGYFHTKKR